MTRLKIFLSLQLIILLTVILSFQADGSESWKNSSYGIGDIDLRAIAVDPQNPNIVYVGSNKAIFRTIDGGLNWQEVLSIKGDKKAVNCLNIDPRQTQNVYAATQNGLFFSLDSGNNWQKKFDNIGELEKDCQDIVINSDGSIYLGTRGGLFHTAGNGKNWNKVSGEIANIMIKSIAIDYENNNNLYIVTDKGVYKSTDNSGSYERIYISSLSESENPSESDEYYDSDNDEQSEKSLELKHLVIDSGNIYLGTNKGVLKSKDKGFSWERLTLTGLLNDNINHILISDKDGELYVATSSGVFSYAQDKWRAIYQGMTANEIRSLAKDNQGAIWAVTKGGVFKTITNDSSDNLEINLSEAKHILNYFKDEPSIQEVRDIAIRYAEVDPKKIRDWRREAKIKAIMPEFDLNYDKTVTTALGASYDKVQVGPMDWGVSLKWDFGELIWNDDQTSIDVRSRLMVQLRDDILDEVTRLYFERRKLQVEILLSPPKELNAQLEKELRIQELTANIDSLTGGCFSRRLRENRCIDKTQQSVF